MLTVEQFLGVADELGWDASVQIEKLEAFADLSGLTPRMEEYLERRGLVGSARWDRKRVRDVMLDFFTEAGSYGAMNRFLHRERRLAAEARAASEAAAENAATPAESVAMQTLGPLAWLRRWFGRARRAV